MGEVGPSLGGDLAQVRHVGGSRRWLQTTSMQAGGVIIFMAIGAKLIIIAR